MRVVDGGQRRREDGAEDEGVYEDSEGERGAVGAYESDFGIAAGTGRMSTHGRLNIDGLVRRPTPTAALSVAGATKSRARGARHDRARHVRRARRRHLVRAGLRRSRR